MLKPDVRKRIRGIFEAGSRQKDRIQIQKNSDNLTSLDIWLSFQAMIYNEAITPNELKDRYNS